MKIDSQPEEENYYDILEIQKNCTLIEVKKAYKLMSKKYHPDLNNDKDLARKKMDQINKAYSVLGDPDKKRYENIFYYLKKSKKTSFFINEFQIILNTIKNIN